MENLRFCVPGYYCDPLGASLPPEGSCAGTPSISEPVEKGGVLLGKGIRVKVTGRVGGGEGNGNRDKTREVRTQGERKG